MRKLYSGPTLIGLLLAALLAGCGQKGPLYLPKSPSQPTSEQAGDHQGDGGGAKTKSPSQPPASEQTPTPGP